MTFKMKKYLKKHFKFLTSFFIYNLIIINDARDATGVPSPPMFVPSKSATPSEVNCDSSTALGTLLIIWLVKRETMNADLFITKLKKVLTLSFCDKFPLKIKKQQNVNNKI